MGWNPLEKMSPSFWEQFLKAFVDAITAFAKNQDAQANFFQKAADLIEHPPHGMIQVISPETMQRAAEMMRPPGPATVAIQQIDADHPWDWTPSDEDDLEEVWDSLTKPDDDIPF